MVVPCSGSRYRMGISFLLLFNPISNSWAQTLELSQSGLSTTRKESAPFTALVISSIQSALRGIPSQSTQVFTSFATRQSYSLRTNSLSLREYETKTLPFFPSVSFSAMHSLRFYQVSSLFTALQTRPPRNLRYSCYLLP